MAAVRKAAKDKLLGDSTNYDDLSAEKKAEADAEFERKIREAEDAKIAEAFKTNSGQSAEERKQAAIDAFKTTDRARDADGKLLTGKALDQAFEKAKRDGAKNNVKKTRDTCLGTQGKTTADCEAEAQEAYFAALGIETSKNNIDAKTQYGKAKEAAAAE